MAEQTGQERSEAPTPKKREDARKEGQVAISRELSSAVLLGTFALYFLLAGRFGLERIAALWRTQFTHATEIEVTGASIWATLRLVVSALTAPILLLFLVVFIVALLTPMLQVGVMLNPLKFQMNRVNPLNGVKRIFSTQGLADLLKSTFKMTVIGYVTYSSLNTEVTPLMSLSVQPVPDILIYNFQLLGTLLVKVTLALAVLAIFDYLYQRWNLDQRLKMTRQEVKDELKQTEGDPTLRSRVRQIQREISQARMMESVPKADVVVTNPTHYAVAMMYDREVMHAPRVVAKGADFLALRIRRVAEENRVPMVENRQVARELYQHVDIGQEIPEQFFRAVAEILAYVYRLKGDGAEHAG